MEQNNIYQLVFKVTHAGGSGSCFYLKDYDLGDVCVALIDDMEQFYTARIVEINETHKSNRIDVELVLGSPSKQKWRK